MPIMSAEQGRRLWQHFARHAPVDVLDIGTCHGTSAAYLAGALRQLGRGRVTTVDTCQLDHLSPAKEMVSQLLSRCGLEEWVTVVRMPHSSYAWWLLEEVRRHTSESDGCVPAYDFIYLDGAKSLTIDATSVVLAERLLRPGGWLLLDDLDWVYADRPEYQPTVVLGNHTRYELSTDEVRTPHVRAVVDHVLRGHPAFGELRLDADHQWAWAQKVELPRQRLTTVTTVEDQATGRVLLRAAAQRAFGRVRRSVGVPR
jgi:predicted O-methyltransferase YrrM